MRKAVRIGFEGAADVATGALGTGTVPNDRREPAMDVNGQGKTNGVGAEELHEGDAMAGGSPRRSVSNMDEAGADRRLDWK